MKVYEIRSHEKSMILTSIDDEVINNHPIESRFDGSSKKVNWTPIRIKTLYKKVYKDFPNYLTGKPIVSAKAKKIIEPFIGIQAEFLPLIHDELELYMMNIMNVIDCVDWGKSKVHISSTGVFAGSADIVFDFSRIPEGTFLFKIKEIANSWAFMTEPLKDLIEQNKLKGLDYSVVFDSEFTEEAEQEQHLNYEAALKEIELNKGKKFTYEEARERVGQGRAVASGRWKMQVDSEGKFWLGELTLDLKYQWISPVYIPPMLLGKKWHEVEKSKL